MIGKNMIDMNMIGMNMTEMNMIEMSLAFVKMRMRVIVRAPVVVRMRVILRVIVRVIMFVVAGGHRPLLCNNITFAQEAPPRKRGGRQPRRAASRACISAGGSLSNSIHSPVTGCWNPSRAAWSAWRPSAARAARAFSVRWADLVRKPAA